MALVIENIAGAGHVIAMQTLARAPANASVLAPADGQHGHCAAVREADHYDAPTAFTPIAIVGAIPLAVVVRTSKVAAKDPKRFIALLTSKADALNYGSSRNGTTAPGPGGRAG